MVKITFEKIHPPPANNDNDCSRESNEVKQDRAATETKGRRMSIFFGAIVGLFSWIACSFFTRSNDKIEKEEE